MEIEKPHDGSMQWVKLAWGANGARDCAEQRRNKKYSELETIATSEE